MGDRLMANGPGIVLGNRLRPRKTFVAMQLSLIAPTLMSCSYSTVYTRREIQKGIHHLRGQQKILRTPCLASKPNANPPQRSFLFLKVLPPAPLERVPRGFASPALLHR